MRYELVTRFDVSGQPVPNAAQAGDELPAVTEGPDRKGHRESKRANDCADDPAQPPLLALIQPEIDGVADMIIAT